MIQETVARKYARALMELAAEDNKKEKYGKEISSFFNMLKSDKMLWSFFVGPSESPENKRAALEEILPTLKYSKVVQNFIRLIFDKERLSFMGDIVDIYNTLLDEAEGRVRAKIISAAPLTKADVNKIVKGLSSAIGKKIVADVSVDPQIIGGIITHVGGLVFDGSIRTQLDNIGNNLKKEYVN
jgi:F-type H+-transporting ATPase subunit delta